VKALLQTVFLLAVPVGMGLCVALQLEQAAIFSTLMTVLPLLYFFFSFERSKILKEIIPIVVLASVAIAARILFAPLPSFKPVFAILIVAGVCFGRDSGFIIGALTALVSNIFFGQGPWTPWQMYAFGLIGFLAGVIGQTKLAEKKWPIFIYAAAVSVLFSLIMDSWFVLGFVRPLSLASITTAYLASTPMTVSYIVSSIIFLSLIYLPWHKKLKRIKEKYG
jgi:energy-coupling factor transport system substrate-specific component